MKLCLITLRPDPVWCQFLDSFTRYKVYIIVDDNNFDLTPFTMYKTLTFIQIPDQDCITAGFRNTNLVLKKEVSGWDKALYYFSSESEYIWFIEDDVYFQEEETLVRIDLQYTKADLLSNRIFRKGEDGPWLWNKINLRALYADRPMYHGMMCAVRFSRELLVIIRNHANRHGSLFFLEAMFPTLAIGNGLVHMVPKELSTIHYRYCHRDTDSLHLYHPVKGNHILYRTTCSGKISLSE